MASVSQFDIYVEKGEIVGLIDPNGAGKITIFNLIVGVFPTTQGRVIYLKSRELR